MILDLGLIDYEEAFKIQRELVAKRALGEIEDSFLILEHPPVFTIGRSGSRANLLFDEKTLNERGIRVLDVDRGGDITFHGPGQLVVYSIIDLKNRARDLHKYLRDLEEVAISFLKRYGVAARRIEGATGVWVGNAKIASIGVAARDWITYHGLGININTDTKYFSMINPCGMKDVRVASLREILGRAVPMYEAKKNLMAEFERVFRIPDHIKKRITVNEYFYETKKAILRYHVNTVCESAKCPNITECFSKKFPTFMILGRECTRSCAFCSVEKRVPEEFDIEEPERIAACAREIGLKYVIVTSVTRDDLADGGAGQFANTVKALRRTNPDIAIELLIPDFQGNADSVKIAAMSGAQIVGHNMETVRRLYPSIRKGADYFRSLDVLSTIKKTGPDILTKSAILLGLGESEEEVFETMKDLRKVGCDILTIGQYLRPSKENHPVKRFVSPGEFDRFRIMGEELGFLSVSAGSFVRSSYYAEETFTAISCKL